VLGRLELDSGRFTWVSAGHPPPLLLRAGRVVRVLDSPPALPLGLGDEDAPTVSEFVLEVGDRLVLFTDGIVEARSSTGALFGEQRLVDLLRKATASGYPAAEAMRRLKHEILGYQNGHLADDATLLVVEWLSRKP
jgi:serine phosphatase RsbU (regulator of sigma subunit)